MFQEGEKSISPRYFSVRRDSRIFPFIHVSPASFVFVGILCNQCLEQNVHAERIDHRSYERQGIDQILTVHLGVAVSAMEKRGIRTERGDLNREIEVTNQKLRQLKARISKLQKWLKEEQENTEPPTLADYIQGILSRKA